MTNLANVTQVFINGRAHTIDGTVTSLAELKEVAVEIDPSLSNADPVVEGNTVVFTRRAGTKGEEVITKVVVGGREHQVDPDMYDNPMDIKEALLEVYPEISNYDYVVSGDTMSFIKRAGTKGY